MKTKHALAPLAAFALFAAACSDPVSTGVNTLGTSASSDFVIEAGILPLAGSGLVENQVEVCKQVSGDPVANWSFTFSLTVDAVAQTDVVLDNTTPCKIVVDRGLTTTTAEVVIAEQGPPQDWTLDHIHVTRFVATGALTPDAVSEANQSATVYVNNDVSRRVTFGNSFDAGDPEGCTYTKGWYRNNGSSTVIGVDGRTVADAQAIFAATPGKPGTVTFGGNNTLLNLYQQLLAALNNLGGDANAADGPDAVDDAIDDALDGTSGGPGTDITTTLSQTEMSALIATLSAFNEGTFEGWPHCDDN
jgi:hypothetical protein